MTQFYWPAEEYFQPPYAAIPAGVDVLVCHGPVQGHVDGGTGCPALRQHVARVRPRLVVCGHIHEARGVVDGAGDGWKVTGAEVGPDVDGCGVTGAGVGSDVMGAAEYVGAGVGCGVTGAAVGESAAAAAAATVGAGASA